MRSKFFMALMRSNVVLIGAIIGFTWGFLTGFITLTSIHGGGVPGVNSFNLEIHVMFLPSLIMSSITLNRSVIFIGSPLIGTLIIVAIALLADKLITSIRNKYKGGG